MNLSLIGLLLLAQISELAFIELLKNDGILVQIFTQYSVVVRWAGGVLAYSMLGILLYGIWRGTRRPSGRTSGRVAGWLRSALFYFLATTCFLGISIYFWKPLPLDLPPGGRLACLVAGILVYFPGMAFLLWARLALGKMYFVSTSFGAQLYADHQLMTRGPFAIVRHPMYLGLIAAALGSLLLYQTWTALAYAVFAPLVLLRARREEAALAAEFGEQWREYCRRVPTFFPRLRR
jgi:protein-S-isoprenylcysteine O-methyltransferase Ste14